MDSRWGGALGKGQSPFRYEVLLYLKLIYNDNEKISCYIAVPLNIIL